MGTQEALPTLPAGLLSFNTPGLVFKGLTYRNKTLLSAWMPKDREQDFISGKGARNHTKYYVNKTHTTKKDLRKSVPSGIPLGDNERRRGTEHGQSCKRGCQAHFALYESFAQPDQLQILLKDSAHLDASGHLCHGPACPGVGRHTAAPSLSSNRVSHRSRSMSKRFHLQYMMQHNLQSIKAARRAMEANERGNPRLYFLSIKDIQNIAGDLEKLDWRFDAEQARSVQIFTERSPENVLFYKPYASAANGAEGQPFQLAWSSPELLELAAEYGHNRTLQMDSTLATNNLKYPPYTILVHDRQGNGMPVAWFCTGSSTADCIQSFLDAFLEKCRGLKSDFKPSCILTDDDDDAEILAIRRAMPDVRVFLCAFHVKTAWARGLREKVPDAADCSRLKDGLEHLMGLAPTSVCQSTQQSQLQAKAALQHFYATNRLQTMQSYYR